MLYARKAGRVSLLRDDVTIEIAFEAMPWNDQGKMGARLEPATR